MCKGVDNHGSWREKEGEKKKATSWNSSTNISRHRVLDEDILDWRKFLRLLHLNKMQIFASICSNMLTNRLSSFA